MPISQTQEWLRVLSQGLENSYIGSAGIVHNSTSGNAREGQIFDVLLNLLPKRLSLKRNVVITDSNDRQSNKFDGVLADDLNWPQIYYLDDMVVAPIESVKVAFEIKSNLEKVDTDKIFEEAKNLSDMKSHLTDDLPIVAGFSYTCTNVNLAFYDFVDNFFKNKKHNPSIICILNKAVFCLLDDSKTIVSKPNSGLMPTLIKAEKDSLLIFVYLLSSFLLGKESSRTIRNYSKELFDGLTSFSFDKKFVENMNDENRKKFFNKGQVDIETIVTT